MTEFYLDMPEQPLEKMAQNLELLSEFATVEDSIENYICNIDFEQQPKEIDAQNGDEYDTSSHDDLREVLTDDFNYVPENLDALSLKVRNKKRHNHEPNRHTHPYQGN
jgi:hypothetical protein